MAKSIIFVIDDPLPVKARFATLFGTTKVVTSTSPESVAVPPTFCNVKVVTPPVSYTHLTLPTIYSV